MPTAILNSNLVVQKADVSEKMLERMDNELRVRNPEYTNLARFSGRNPAFRKQVSKYLYFYEENSSQYILPRNFPLDEDWSIEDERVPGKKSRWDCSIKLRDYQKAFFADKDFSTGDVILEMPCGSGKTECAIWMAHRYAVVTLVLVPTIVLAQQWKKRIEDRTTARVFFYQSHHKELPEGYDWYICSMDLFTVRNLPRKVRLTIGHIVLDEYHRMAASSYLPILSQIQGLYRTACTATFRRPDGLHKGLKTHLGAIWKMDQVFPRSRTFPVETGIWMDNLLNLNRKGIKEPEFFLDWLRKGGENVWKSGSVASYSGSIEDLKNRARTELGMSYLSKTRYEQIERCLKAGEKANYSLMDTYLAEHERRFKQCEYMIRACMKAGRKVLFLSKRKDVLKKLHEEFPGSMLIVSETGDLSEDDERRLQKECRLVFGIFQLAKEGLDVPSLDTLILHCPVIDTEQPVGRIARLSEGKKSPIVLYMVDNCQMSQSMFYKSRAYLNINSDIQKPITIDQINSIL